MINDREADIVIFGGAVRIYADFMNDCGFHVLDDEAVLLEKFNMEIIGFDDYKLGQTEEDFYHIQSDYFISLQPMNLLFQDGLKVLVRTLYYQEIRMVGRY